MQMNIVQQVLTSLILSMKKWRILMNEDIRSLRNFNQSDLESVLLRKTCLISLKGNHVIEIRELALQNTSNQVCKKNVRIEAL